MCYLETEWLGSGDKSGLWVILCKDGCPATGSITINVIITVSSKTMDVECKGGTQMFLPDKEWLGFGGKSVFVGYRT
jgi:hypothetical protein